MSYKSTSLCLCLLAVCLLQFVCADVETNEVNDITPQSYWLQGIQVYANDRHCSMVGGLCVHTSDCLEPTTNKGLCPSSAHLGVECCYELPVKPATCSQNMGECMSWCNPGLRRRSTDCKEGTHCCVLV